MNSALFFCEKEIKFLTARCRIYENTQKQKHSLVFKSSHTMTHNISSSILLQEEFFRRGSKIFPLRTDFSGPTLTQLYLRMMALDGEDVQKGPLKNVLNPKCPSGAPSTFPFHTVLQSYIYTPTA